MAPPSLPKAHLSIFLAGTFAFGAAVFLVLPYAFAGTYMGSTPPQASTASTTLPAPVVLHLATPAVVKGIYMSQCVAGTPSFRNSLVKFIEVSELNAVVIDIKDYSGGISFPTDDPALAANVSKQCGAHDIKEFIASLHAKGIYVIGRITVFQDPTYTKEYPEQAVQDSRGGTWKNYGGLSFVDVSSKPFWDYIVELSKVAYQQEGFDELNYDYIRYPSDGPIAEALYQDANKPEAVEKFFQYLSQNVRPTGAVISADLFGYVTVHTDDLGIGQVLERALPYFDYIDPMVYPSHYNSGFLGLKDVNSGPYRIVYASLTSAVARAIATTTPVAGLSETPIASTTPQLYEKVSYPVTKIRPWLQSFDYPIVYTPAMVAAQIKATNDAGLESYLVWDAANKYNALRQVLATASSTTQ